MSRSIYIILFLILPLMASAQVYGTEKGMVKFHSDAPLELIRASSNNLKGKFDVAKKLFAFVLPISSFEGFNNPLQKEHFNENYMETKIFPNATFSGKIIEDIDITQDGSYTLRAKGNLTVHGVVQERIIKSDVQVRNGNLSVHSEFTVLLADHNIPIPKVVHEKLASEIKVEINAELTTP